MSSWTATEQRIVAVLRERMALDVPSAHTDLIASGYLDSLTLVELLRHLEGDLGYVIRLEDLEIDQLRTIAKLAELVGKQGDDARGRLAAKEETDAGGSTLR